MCKTKYVILLLNARPITVNKVLSEEIIHKYSIIIHKDMNSGAHNKDIIKVKHLLDM